MWNSTSSEIEREVNSGERLLWSGRPQQGIRLRPSDALMIPFSLLWCGFAVFWEVGVAATKAPFFFKLWGIPFVLVGLYMVFGRFFVEARMRRQTFYGVTSERIIIVTGLFSRQTKSLQLRSLSDISLSERTDGSGTVTFGPQYLMAPRVPAGWPGAGHYAAPSFDLIDRAKEVYDLIRRTQKSAG
jgi:hypothetical protein